MASPLMVAVAALLVTLAPAARMLRHNKTGQMQDLTVSSVPMYMYKRDCWKRRHWSFAQVQEEDDFPGAGMNLSDIEPFKEVLKDGYYTVDCVKDYMLEFADKHGKNKFQYNQGEVSAVSVVRYSDVVPKTDQEPMSHKVCFAFCRGIPDMGFFGIKNGRDCYCTPYYKEMASDSSMCDAVCPAEQTLMCGGKSKSSIFSMHNCAKTDKELTDESDKASGMATALGELATKVKTAGDTMEADAGHFQTLFSESGDPGASGLMQEAKIFSGELLAAAGAAEKLKTSLSGMATEATGMTGSNFGDATTATKAETLLEEMEEEVAKCEVSSDELTALLEKADAAASNETNYTGMGDQYYPIMYFVDKKYVNMSTTCAGTTISKPLLGTYDSCAGMCDKLTGECVGFSHTVSGESGLCFLFSEFKTAMYYTGCPEDKVEKTVCEAKFSSFSGTTLKPDPSGKCTQCLKEAKEAARCYEK